MLSANTQKIIQCLQRSFSTSKRSLAYAAATPLTDPLKDDTIVTPETVVPEDVQITTLDNGVKIASCDNGGAVSTVVVAVKAGSRFENINNLGVSHLMKNAAFLTTNGGNTALSVVREIQSIGGSLECSSSRELISRKSVGLRAHLETMLANVLPGILIPFFPPWEVAAVKDQCKGDLSTLDCVAKNIEFLHQAAYKDGLGNSTFCDELRLGNMNYGHLEEFATQCHVGEGVTIVATNADHDSLVALSKKYVGELLRGEPGEAAVQKFRGGEVRANTSTGFTCVSLAGPGAGLCSTDLPAFAVLQTILGDSTSIKWGSKSASRLYSAVKSATHDPFEISSLNISYSDAGLFGLHAISTPSAIGSVVGAALGAVHDVASGEISAEDVARAKTQVKARVLMLNEGNDDHIDDLLKQVAFTGGYAKPTQTFDLIDAVPLEKVVEVAKLIFDKPALAVTGNSVAAPYLDEL